MKMNSTTETPFDEPTALSTSLGYGRDERRNKNGGRQRADA
ncbi:MAG: hypothetical protein R6V05_00375 [Candidatus Brocadiia bacterium]